MIKHTQDKLHIKDENGNVIQHGNCYATTIACLLDLPVNMVPNIETLYIMEGYLYQEVLDRWLKAKGYSINYNPSFQLFHKEREQYVSWLNEMKKKEFIKENKDILYLVSGETIRGTRHICIYKNGNLYWDVHPSRNGLIHLDTFQTLEKI